MKPPLISYYDRRVMREFPDTFLAQRLNGYLALSHLKRDIGNIPLIKKYMNFLTSHINSR